MRHLDTSRQAGFSMIEVLAALLVTAAFVAVVLPFADRLIGEFGRRRDGIEGADLWNQVILRLTDDIAQAVPATEGGNNRFEVDATSIRFIRPRLAEAGPSGIEEVRLRIETAASGDSLKRLTRASGTRPATEVILLAGPWHFRFDAIDERGQHVDHWPVGEALPAAVELITTGAGAPHAIVLPLVGCGLSCGATVSP